MLRNLISVNQFQDKKTVDEIFKIANKFENSQKYPQTLKNKVVASLFFEPSTRTRFSFETAVYRLGGNVITVENGNLSSSAVKGESIEDTIRTINAYADAIVMRHPSDGAAEKAAAAAKVPFINAGEGAGEHPTQALLDLYTIKQSKGSIDKLKIALVGDLLYGRTVHSLLYFLSMYDVELCLISPPALKTPKKYLDKLDSKAIKYVENESWEDCINDIDVLYMTRVQKERFDNLNSYKKYKDAFIFNKLSLSQLKRDAVILHPLPRVNEISSEVDKDPRALYFQQVKNGLFVRMALIHYIFRNAENGI